MNTKTRPPRSIQAPEYGMTVLVQDPGINWTGTLAVTLLPDGTGYIARREHWHRYRDNAPVGWPQLAVSGDVLPCGEDGWSGYNCGESHLSVKLWQRNPDGSAQSFGAGCVHYFVAALSKPKCPSCDNALFDCGINSQPLYCGACQTHHPRPVA